MTRAEIHPQRSQIIDGILAGDSLRKIQSRIVPRLSVATLGRYRLTILANAVSPLHGRSPNNSDIKDIAAANNIIQDPNFGENAFLERTRQDIQKALLEREKRRAKWESDAESYQYVDPETGEVKHNMEHSALARHDANALKAIELRAKLSGLLTETQSTGNVQIALLFPGQVPQEQAPQVIDIKALRK